MKQKYYLIYIGVYFSFSILPVWGEPTASENEFPTLTIEESIAEESLPSSPPAEEDPISLGSFEDPLDPESTEEFFVVEAPTNEENTEESEEPESSLE